MLMMRWRCQGAQRLPIVGNSIVATIGQMPLMFRSHKEAWANFPKPFLYCVLLISVLPIFLSVLGINFGSDVLPIEMDVPRSTVDTEQLESMTTAQLQNIAFLAIKGGLHHAILEWTSIIVALLATILAFSHFAIKRDLTTPVIGVVLYCCAIMDGFHALVGLRLIPVVAPYHDLIPFSWALSRGFSAVMIILGGLICFRADNVSQRYGLAFIFMLTGLFATLAYVLIAYASLSPVLPQTQFPDAFISRPYDLGPLVLFAIAAPLFWGLYKRFPSHLTAALLLLLIPNIALEAHMVFGSTGLYDEHFNIAHGLKIISYGVPFAGLTMDYIATYRAQEDTSRRLKRNERSLNRAVEELRISNDDLETFAYVASHDLKSPLRAIDNLTLWLTEDLEGQLDGENKKRLEMVRGRVKRMDRLLDSLLEFSRAGRNVSTENIINAKDLVYEIRDILHVPEGFDVIVNPSLGSLNVPRMPLEQILHNLINNALKHHDKTSGVVTVDGRKQGAFFVFSVADDGPGIPIKYQEKIFEMFHTLKRRDEVEGSGMGLALVQKIIHRFGGRIDVQSEGERGTSFVFHWPLVPKVRDTDGPV